MINARHILATVMFFFAVVSCDKDTPASEPQPSKDPEIEKKAPAFKFYVTDLDFIPGQTAEIAFKHEGVSLTSCTVPSGWTYDLSSSPDVIAITAPDAFGSSFASGGTIKLHGQWEDRSLDSNELKVNLLGINSQDDWNTFSGGKTDGFIVDGQLFLNCNVKVTRSLEKLTVPMDAHGHTVTLAIPAENSLGGLFGTVEKSVKNLNIAGEVALAATGDDDSCASLAAGCSQGVKLQNVHSSADVVLDFQTRHLSSCALSGIVALGSPEQENCSFTGKLKALNCDCGQDVSFLKDAEVDIPTGCFSLRQLKITSDEIGNSYILQTEGGKVVVFDGGNTDQASNLLKNLKEKYGYKVDEWWLSHPHSDHVSAFCEIIKAEEHIPVGKVVYSKMPANIVAVEAGVQSTLLSRLNKYTSEGGTVVDLQNAGERFEIDGVFFKVLGVATDEFPQRGSPFPSPANNASVVVRVWDREKSVIFLGDAQELKGTKVLDEFGPYMHCDYLQMGHHGNWTCGRTFYDTVDFKAALWPTPTFLWTCKSGNGSGWDCWRYREWVAAKGVTENHVSCQGDWLLEMGTTI